MSKDTVSIFKLFWADQDQEQEQWLREMARQGLHLKNVNIFCNWTFVRGEPADIAYRVDFSGKGKNSAYQRLFEDAGWERAAEVTGWLYWRKPVVNGQAPEIFTDIESMIGKYRRVLSMLATTILPAILFLVIVNKHSAAELSAPLLATLIALNVIPLPLFAYAAIRLHRRIRNIRNASA